jgi:hypothetical protein
MDPGQYDYFIHQNLLRSYGRTRAKALQTVSRFPRETRRRYAAPKSNEFTLIACWTKENSLHVKGY